MPCLQAVGKLHTLWIAFAKFYERHGDIENARVIFDKATQVRSPRTALLKLSDGLDSHAMRLNTGLVMRQPGMGPAAVLAKYLQPVISSAYQSHGHVLPATSRQPSHYFTRL